MDVIYLDHQATTPLDPAVRDSMLPFLTTDFGNAASRSHQPGRTAADGVEHAREQVAAAIGSEARAITFTSGATESINLALLGAARYAGAGHIVTVATEHPATLDCCRALEAEGFSFTRVSVDEQGVLAPEAIEAALRKDTILVSVLHANNEIGTVHDLAEIGRVSRAHGAFLHVDAAQSVGKLPIDVEAMQIDLLSASAHKIYGPKGVGALYCRRRDPRVRLKPLLHGGGHERGMRPGTLNVPGIVGFGVACERAVALRDSESARLTALAARLREGVERELGVLPLNGPRAHRLPGNLNLQVAGVDAAALLVALPGLALSMGSACTSAIARPSHVLRAIGCSPDEAQSSLRIGLGRFTTEAEVDSAVAQIASAVQTLRNRDSVQTEGASCAGF